MTIFSKNVVVYSILIEFWRLAITDCYVIARKVFSFQISAVHVHSSLIFVRTAILLSKFRFTDQNLVQPRAPVDDAGSCRIRDYESDVALDLGLLCRHAMSGEESRRFGGS